MQTKLILPIILILLLGITMFVSAQGTVLDQTTSEITTPSNERTSEQIQEDIQARNQELMEKNIFNITLIFLAIVASIISTIITIFMIKKNPLILNIIIHGVVLLGSLIGGVIIAFDNIRCIFDQYCSTTPFVLVYLITIPSFFFSLIIIRNLVWKKKYSNKYSTNMSSGTIYLFFIFTIFSFIAEIIIKPSYDLPASLFIPILTIPITLALYFMLGIIGLFIDRSK